MKYRLIDAEKDHHSVSQLARVLGVSRRGYYAWASRGPSVRAQQDAALTETIATIRTQARGTYGAPCIHAELREDYGIRIGRKRVARLMRRARLQYTSFAFGRRCRDGGIRPLTGSVGDCYDNAITESFFATLECELLDRCRFTTRAQAKAACFDFIERFYNTRRRHSANGMLSPTEYERRNRLQPSYSAAA